MHSCQRWFKRFQWQRWWASCRRWSSWTAQESAVQQCHLHPERQMFEMVWSHKKRFQKYLPESRRSSRWIWQIQSQLPKIPIHFSQLTIELVVMVNFYHTLLTNIWHPSVLSTLIVFTLPSTWEMRKLLSEHWWTMNIVSSLKFLIGRYDPLGVGVSDISEKNYRMPINWH